MKNVKITIKKQLKSMALNRNPTIYNTMILSVLVSLYNDGYDNPRTQKICATLFSVEYTRKKTYFNRYLAILSF